MRYAEDQRVDTEAGHINVLNHLEDLLSTFPRRRDIARGEVHEMWSVEGRAAEGNVSRGDDGDSSGD